MGEILTDNCHVLTEMILNWSCALLRTLIPNYYYILHLLFL